MTKTKRRKIFREPANDFTDDDYDDDYDDEYKFENLRNKILKKLSQYVILQYVSMDAIDGYTPSYFETEENNVYEGMSKAKKDMIKLVKIAKKEPYFGKDRYDYLKKETKEAIEKLENYEELEDTIKTAIEYLSVIWAIDR